MDTGAYIAASVFFICLFGGMSVTEGIKAHEKGQVQVACYAAQAEAMKQHVEFKQDCSK